MTEVHEFVRRYAPRRQEGDAAANPENLNSLIRRVAGASVEEIEQVILELQRFLSRLAVLRFLPMTYFVGHGAPAASHCFKNSTNWSDGIGRRLPPRSRRPSPVDQRFVLDVLGDLGDGAACRCAPGP